MIVRRCRVVGVIVVAFVVSASACADNGEDITSPDEFLGWLESNRERAGLAAFVDGAEAAGIYLNAEKPFPLGSTRKALILGAYADRIADTVLDPDEHVPVGDVERWYWRGTDGGAHERAIEDWRETDRIDASDRVRLDDIAHAMIRWSDNAAADYILDRVGGPPAARAFANRAGMKSQEPLMPVLGEFVVWSTDKLDEWTELGAEGRAMRAVELARTTKSSQLRQLERPSVDDQLEFARTSPMGTPRDWAQLMSVLYRGEGLAKDARDVIHRHLEWPLEVFSTNRERFEHFGAKGGSLAGVITEAMYIKPKGRETMAVALFLRDLPSSQWTSFTQSFVHQRFVLELVQEPQFRDKARARLS